MRAREGTVRTDKGKLEQDRIFDVVSFFKKFQNTKILSKRS